MKTTLARRFGSVLTALTLVVGVASNAAAQTHDTAAAEALFKEGRAAAEAKDFVTACAKFRESEKLDHATGTLFNIADCEEQQGHVATAWSLFEDVVQQVGATDDRAPIARDRAAALIKRVPKLIVRLAPGAPAETTAERDGVAIGAASLGVALPVDPGEHVLSAKSPGRFKTEVHVALREGETKEVAVSPGALEPKPPPPPPVYAPPPPTSSWRRPFGFAIGGAGLASLGVGIATGVVTMGKKTTVDNHCNDTTCDSLNALDAVHDGKTFSTISTITFIGGLALIGGGVILVATGGPRAAPSVGLSVGPSGTSLLGSF